MKRMLLLIGSLLLSTSAFAGEADVTGVKATETSSGTYRFDVTVHHADEGWDHFANKWQVVAPDGKVLGTRVLAHPHVGQDQFTRSLGGIEIPGSIKEVTIRAGDSVHDLGGKEIKVKVN